MRTRIEVIDFCLSLDDTYEDYPFHDFNWTVMRHKGNKKMFAATYEHIEKTTGMQKEIKTSAIPSVDMTSIATSTVNHSNAKPTTTEIPSITL